MKTWDQGICCPRLSCSKAIEGLSFSKALPTKTPARLQIPLRLRAGRPRSRPRWCISNVSCVPPDECITISNKAAGLRSQFLNGPSNGRTAGTMISKITSSVVPILPNMAKPRLFVLLHMMIVIDTGRTKPDPMRSGLIVPNKPSLDPLYTSSVKARWCHEYHCCSY